MTNTFSNLFILGGGKSEENVLQMCKNAFSVVCCLHQTSCLQYGKVIFQKPAFGRFQMGQVAPEN